MDRILFLQWWRWTRAITCWWVTRARAVLLTSPERTVYSVKRLMGRGVEDVQEELKLFPFRLAEDLRRAKCCGSIWANDLYAAGDFSAHSAPAEAQCGALSGRAGKAGRHHGACVFQ